MKNKTKKILSGIPSVLISMIIASGAILKLLETPQLVEIYTKTGLLQYMKILGIAELLFTAMFLWHRSMKIGFCLLTGYFGGAMAVEMSHGTIFILPGIILAIIWIAAYLRDGSIFRPVKRHEPALPAM